MNTNRVRHAALTTTLLACLALPSCALDANGHDPAVESEAIESADMALDPIHGGDEVTDATSQYCTGSSLAVKALKSVCDSGFIECQTGSTCSATTHSTEVFTGTTQRPAPSTIAHPRSTHFGGRGRKMANAGLCLLKDLAAKKAVTPTVTKGLVSAKQTVGFRHFNRANHRVDGYRQTRACLPVFGCADLPPQEFSATIVQNRHEGLLSSGDYPTDRVYALRVDTQDVKQSVNVRLPTITVPTPAGPVTVKPSGGYSTGTNVVAAIGGDLYGEPKWIGPILLPNNPRYSTTATGLLTDLQGRYAGSIFVYNPGSSGGWLSQVQLGSRAAKSVWSGPATISNPRPDLAIDRPRNATEMAPNANLYVQAEVAYDPTALLPDLLKTSYITIREAQISVTPRYESNIYSQFGILSDEIEFVDPDLQPFSYTNIVMPTSVGVDHQLTITGRIRLKIDFCMGICKNLVDVDESISVVAIKPDPKVKSGPSASVTINRWNAYNFETKSSSIWPGLRVVDEGSYSHMTSFSGAGNNSNAEQFVSQCLAQEVQDQTLPKTSYTTGKPADFNASVEFPCNLCVQTKKVSSFLYTGHLISILPSSSNPLPADKQWKCEMSWQVGCHDWCRMDVSTGKMVVTRSAVDNPKQECRYSAPK